MTSFRRLLTRYRKRAHLSMNDLARRAGLDPSHISRLEAGWRATPPRTTVLHLAYALGLSSAEGDQLLIAAGYAPDWLRDLAPLAPVMPRTATRTACAGVRTTEGATSA